jgi:serine/threonine protein kinase
MPQPAFFQSCCHLCIFACLALSVCLQVKLRPTATPAAAADGSSASNAAEAASKQQQQQHQTTDGSDSSNAVPIPWSCSDESLLQLIASRDPQGIGLEGGLALRLLQRLLAWDPVQRPTAAQALQHAYFTAVRPPQGNTQETVDGQHGPNDDERYADASWRAGNVVREQPRLSEEQKRQPHTRQHGQQDAAAALQEQVERVRALLQQQAAALQGCSTIPIGDPGWC